MPHKCTRCENIFLDGAIEILSGCPNCGWNKFLYVRSQPSADLAQQSEEQQPAKKFLKEIDEILGESGVKVESAGEIEDDMDDDRIESVRILAPGSYELNLDALLERKEIIMAIKEDGTYMLHLPSVFESKKPKKKKKKS